MRRTISVALAVLVLVLGGAACGGDDETAGNGDTTTTETTTTDETTTADDEAAEGRAVFVANCGTCHTLSEAGTTGTVGPELDGRALSTDAVETQVRNGGVAMPPFEGQLSDDEIDAVADYVAEASSS